MHTVTNECLCCERKTKTTEKKKKSRTKYGKADISDSLPGAVLSRDRSRPRSSYGHPIMDISGGRAGQGRPGQARPQISAPIHTDTPSPKHGQEGEEGPPGTLVVWENARVRGRQG